MAPSLSKDGSGTTVLADGLEGLNFMANGHVILSDVASNITASPSPYTAGDKTATTIAGCFVGFETNKAKSHHVVPVGKLKNIRFMSIFRFKVWWTTQWIGTNGGDLEHETQMVILDKSESGRPYVLLFRYWKVLSRLLCSPVTTITSTFEWKVGRRNESLQLLIPGSSVHSRRRRPFFSGQGGHEVMNVARDHLGTFKLMEEKTPPRIVDKFGWCTWDAFYLNVHPQGVLEGLKGLVDGGCPPGLVLIDDGWLSISNDDDPINQEGMNRTSAGEEMPCRLIKFQENYKFRDFGSPTGSESGAPTKGMGEFIRDLKGNFKSVDYVYVWHALCGYWVVSGSPESRVAAPKLTPGLQNTMEDLAVDKIVNNGVGLVPPEIVEQMYESLHSHLESVGIDGVRVDVIHLLEMLCEDSGGRVELAKAYYKALTSSVRNHFKGNGVIASVEHCNDFMFLTSLAPRPYVFVECTDPSGDPNGTFWLQGCHTVHCAYNSLWMGNFIHPDWDMFQSTHPCAEFHATSRAISGGPIYVSDSVGKHNFELLKTLVLPDGSILRCYYYALPIRDCPFEDPLHNGKTMLKIWNLNKYTGVLGAFNRQGGGWSHESRRNKCASEHSHAVTSMAIPIDIEWKHGTKPISIEGVQVFALYMFREKKLVLSNKFFEFAPFGLVNMLNTGGAIQALEFDEEACTVRVGVKRTGEMRVYAS
ncbi:unnamed protein product [Ilex paraguariensis]|uniref:galactinol--sucrose galactosyltransferase n=1 Tax=Ilex paraguariensis TaxID=185542 RepID=A0ABC8RMX6_9AQUA